MPPPRISCGNCGEKIPLPAGYTRAKLRCPQCGYYAEVPADLRKLSEDPPPQTPFDEPKKKSLGVERAGQLQRQADATGPEELPERPKPVKARPSAKRRFDQRDHRPDFRTDEPAGPPLLEGTQEVHDDQALPYTVPGDGVITCPVCRGELPLDATFCVHCGTDLITGEVVREKTVRGFTNVYEEAFPLAVRLRLFIVLQIVNLPLLALMIIATGQSWTSTTSLVSNFFGHIIHVALQAFLVGSFDTLIVKRNSKGQAWVTRIRRIAFFKLPEAKIPWKKSINVGIVPTHGQGYLGLIIFLYLLTLGCLPGLIFYFVVMRPERFQVCLCDVYGGVDEIVFRTRSLEWANEITGAIAEATGLHRRKVI
jgi:predicted RNA-binding Zn-ribbon protein involved in translation (DUF1610 family)